MSAILVGVFPVSGDTAEAVSILDLVELDMGYTTISDEYYQRVAPQRLLDGARVGLVAYLRMRGLNDAQIPLLHARPDGRGVVPAIEQQIGKLIERYGDRVDARDLMYAAIRGELAALRDPYTVFFDRHELQGFTRALDGATFGGVGMVLAQDGSQFRVDSVFEGSPAAKAGIRAGDRLITIEGHPAMGLSASQIGALLHGRSGTTVRLDLGRPDLVGIEHLMLTRAEIRPPDVETRLFPGDVGYVALRAFAATAGRQVRTAVTDLRARGARAMILDLRGNGGGYEAAAIDVASVFVPSGTLVVTREQHGHVRITHASGSALPLEPLVVLVDGDSASASELVTGALVDHRLATVVGTRTFGKGVVQTIFPLPDGCALKVTTARYFTPNGHDINGVGVTPDVLVAEPSDAQRAVLGRDPQLDAAVALMSRPVPLLSP